MFSSRKILIDARKVVESGIQEPGRTKTENGDGIMITNGSHFTQSFWEVAAQRLVPQDSKDIYISNKGRSFSDVRLMNCR